jgi:tetratricopeptide (TPR) repeat protein
MPQMHPTPPVSDETEATDADRIETGPASDDGAFGRDPVVMRLLAAAAIILAAWVVGIVLWQQSGDLFPDVPRTSAERTLRVYEADIDAGTMDPESWADYVGVLTSAGQYGRAQEVIDTVLPSLTDGRSLVLLEQARLHLARERYEEALEAADEAILAAQEELADVVVDQEAVGIEVHDDRLPQEELAVLLKAEIHEAAGDRDQAIEFYSRYLEYQPTAANIYSRRGDLKAEAGDIEGAESDYLRALEFGDDPGAIEGLEEIGVER